jgi:hypothetical protein
MLVDMTGVEIIHHIGINQLGRLYEAVAKPAPLYHVLGAKNTLDREDPDYSPSYVSEEFATREEAERDAIRSGYPLTEIVERMDWIAPAWWYVLAGIRSKN